MRGKYPRGRCRQCNHKIIAEAQECETWLAANPEQDDTIVVPPGGENEPPPDPPPGDTTTIPPD